MAGRLWAGPALPHPGVRQLRRVRVPCDVVLGDDIARTVPGLHLASMRISGPFLTVPNMLSLSRLALLPVFFWALSTPGYAWLAGGLIAYAVLSDLLDGWVARRFHQASEWGRLLDPLADKVTAGCVLVYCYLHRDLPGWFLALALGRDLVILALAPLFAVRRHSLPGSLLAGRLAALAVGLVALAFLLEIGVAQRALLAAGTLLIFLSSWQYARRLFSHAH